MTEKQKKFNLIIKKFLLIIVFFLTQNCKKENITPEFEKYVDTFIAEGAKRGWKLSKGNLVVKFNPNKNGASQCQPGNIVLINEGLWERDNELSRETVIFHELGHCILNLYHNNCLLPDGTSESIMCGIGGNCGTTYCFSPYGGMRKAYYLDQLFAENPVPAPWWSKLDEVKDEAVGKKRTRINTEEFNDISKINVYLTNTYSSSNGQLNIEGNSYITFKNITKEQLNQANTEVEASFKNSNNGDGFNLQWFPIPKNKTIHNSYGIGVFYKNGDVFLSLSINGLAGYQKKITDQIEKDNYNRLKIIQTNDLYYFYLNDKLVYIQDFVDVEISKPSIDGKESTGQITLSTSGKCSIDYVRVNKLTF